MEMALYYTLSTIAPSLAGALAVLVAFVLFRLTELDRAIQQAQSDLQMRLTDWPKWWEELRVNGPEVLKEGVPSLPVEPFVWAIYRAGHSAWQTRPKIICRLYVALGFTVLDVGVCFIALPFTPWITASKSWSITILALTVWLGVVSLGLYVWLILAMVKRPQ
jgi:hypothetical protein